MCVPQFICSSVIEQLGCFHVTATVNSVAMSMYYTRHIKGKVITLKTKLLQNIQNCFIIYFFTLYRVREAILEKKIWRLIYVYLIKLQELAVILKNCKDFFFFFSLKCLIRDQNIYFSMNQKTLKLHLYQRHVDFG